MARESTVKLGLDIAGFRQSLSEAIKGLRGLSSEETTVKIGVDDAPAQKGLRDSKKSFIKAGEQAGEGFNDGFKSAAGAAALGGFVGTIGASITQGLQTALTDAIAAGSNFETALQSVSAVTGVTGDGLNDLGERAKNLALQFGGSATTQLEAFQTVLSKFGPDLASAPEALTTVAESVNVLGKAAGLDAKASVDALSNSMLQFGVDASDPAKLAQESGRFINVLAASAKVGAAEIPQVAEAILQAGVAAKGANLSFEETNAAIQQLAVGGKVGSEAGVSLRNVIGLLTKQSGPGEKALAGVGLSIKDLGETLTTQGLTATLEKLRGGIDKLGTDAEKAAFKATLFGTENASAAGILLGGIDNLKAFTEGVTGTSEAQAQAAKNSDTLAARFDKLKAAVEVGFINAFQAVSPIVKSLLDNLGTVVPIVVALAAAVAAYTVVSNASAIATQILAAKTAILNAVMAANPAGLVAVAVVALTAGIIALADAMSISTEEALENAEAEKELIQNQIQANKERKVSVTQTKSLAAQFTELANKADRTVAEEKRLQEIQRELDKQYPDLIDQTKSFADNLKGVEEIGKRTTSELDKLGKEAEALGKRLEQSTRNVAFATRNIAIEAFQDAADDADVEKAGEQFVNALYGARNEEAVRRAESAFLEVVNLAVKAGEIGNQELLALDKARTDAVAKTIATFAKKVDATNEDTAAIEKNTDKTDDNKDANEEAAKAADALAKARAALAAQERALEKQRALAAANLIADETERQKEVARIEARFQVLSFEAERKALTSKGKLRAVQGKTIDAKVIAANEALQNKLTEIDAKATADRLKREEDAQKKLNEITSRIAKQRVDDLLAQLKAGNVAIAGEVAEAQRAAIDRTLADTIDKIVQSTPAYVAAAKVIQRELLAGLIDETEARRRTDNLRQSILQELLALPADASNVYAAQIRNAYDQASDEIVKGTRDITEAVNTALAESKTPGFIASLGGLKQALKDVDYKGIVKESKKAGKEIAKNQEDIVQQLLKGEATYQQSVGKFAELEQQRAEASSVTAEILTQAITAAAQQQLDAAQEQIAVIDQIKRRNEEIAAETVSIEKRKNEAIALLREEDFASAQLYEDAKRKLNEDATAQIDKLNKEQTRNTEAAERAQSQALLNIAASAGAAFAGLLAGTESASAALKTIVGDTVQSLISLYAPAIIGGFQSIIPGPIGFVLGSAAVTALQALLKVALAGFSEGGYTGNVGTSSVAGVVHGQEFVTNAKATKANRGLLEHINKGGTVDSYGALPVSEFAAMRTELAAIRQRLDRIPDITERRDGVDVKLGLDTVLYERQRHRFMARSLRG